MAASKVGDLTLGNFLKIVSKGAVYNNLSEDSRLWDYIKKKKKGDTEGRELRYLLRSAFGAAAASFVAANNGAYPDASQSTINEGTGQYKDFALTVEVERTLIDKALSDMSRYGEPLAEELRAKTIAIGYAKILVFISYLPACAHIRQATLCNDGTMTDIGTTAFAAHLLISRF